MVFHKEKNGLEYIHFLAIIEKKYQDEVFQNIKALLEKAQNLKFNLKINFLDGSVDLEQLASNFQPDMAIVDAELIFRKGNNSLEGIELVKKLRDGHPALPIMVMTNKDPSDERIKEVNGERTYCFAKMEGRSICGYLAFKWALIELFRIRGVDQFFENRFI